MFGKGLIFDKFISLVDLSGINECITIKHACSQKCKDKKIGYECSCEKGFKLDMDQTSCIGKIYFSVLSSLLCIAS